MKRISVKIMNKKGILVVVPKRGLPVSPLVWLKKIREGLLESLEILHDQSLVRSLNRALQEACSGRTHSHKEVFRD